MPFDSLCRKMSDEALNSKKYEKTDERKFFRFEEEDYKRDGESAKVVSNRTNGGDDKRIKPVKDEIKLAWMCGMERERRVQCKCLNYSEMMRNNCLFRKTAEKRFKHIVDVMKG